MTNRPLPPPSAAQRLLVGAVALTTACATTTVDLPQPDRRLASLGNLGTRSNFEIRTLYAAQDPAPAPPPRDQKSERRRAEVHVEPHAVGQGKVNRQQQIKEYKREAEAENCSTQPEEHALDEHLTCERASRRTECAANCDLLVAIQGTRHQEAREIGTRQQKHQPDGDDQQQRCGTQQRISSRHNQDLRGWD